MDDVLDPYFRSLLLIETLKKCQYKKKNFTKLPKKNNLIGYKIKYNVNETFYYSPNKPIIRLYQYDILFDNKFNTNEFTPFIINKTKSYKNY